MSDPAVRSEPLGLFYKAWPESPDDNTQQPTHAVEPGFRIAVCGAMTSAQDGPWPHAATAWDSPMSRCSVCSTIVYSAPADVA